MFTGLIEETGTVKKFVPSPDGSQLELTADRLASTVQIGDSVAVNGCCLTVARKEGNAIGFDLLAETVARTNFSHLETGALVNLERALAVGARLGGHFVQGHVDDTGEIIALDRIGHDVRLQISIAAEHRRFLVNKGSIALNGISLTVSEVTPDGFVVWIIPHTWAQTNLRAARAGDRVNLEFDLLAKYVERLLPSKTTDA